MLELQRYSFGVGDRFAHQAAPQLRAFQKLAEQGVAVAPVWNKSNREHSFIGSEPASVRQAAEKAVAERGWTGPWHVDADHIGLATVDRYLDCSDFFTIDVADSIGQPPEAGRIEQFLAAHPELVGEIAIAGVNRPLRLTAEAVRGILEQYAAATALAGRIYRRIADHRGEDSLIAEVSMDETDQPQTPLELLVILALLADEGVRVQTIAPKFTGRFNKGVDYVGDLQRFEAEFNEDLAVIDHAVRTYGLPSNLKLSVHSGSDKFSLYPIIRAALQRTGRGLHLKTAGTTWLEELIGLADAGGAGLQLVQDIYEQALASADELSRPYAAVIDIDPSRLPAAELVRTWNGAKLANTIRHVPDHPDFNANVRQLLHIAFKLAAKQGPRYLDLLRANADIVGRNVTENIFERHMKPLFLS